jgi:preprotein translocase subunit SecG
MLFLIVKSILVIIEVGSAILLCGVILIQKSKQHGAGLAIGGGMGETLFGGQVTGVLTKFTVIVASVFLVNTALLTIAVNRRVSTSGVDVKAVLPSLPQTGAAGAPPQVAPGTMIPSGAVEPMPAATVPAAAVPVEAAAPDAAKPEAPKTAE